MNRKLKIVKPAAGSYAEWMSKMDTAVEAECTKLRKCAPKRTPESESLDLDLAKMRRKRMYSVLSDISRLLIVADDLALATIPSDSERAGNLRGLIAMMRKGGFNASNLFLTLPMSEFVKAGE